MEIAEILKLCDHTLLRVDCTSAEIMELCDQAMKYSCASVCIPPCHVAGAKRYVGDKLKICTVIGFPNGYMTTAAKAFEAADVEAPDFTLNDINGQPPKLSSLRGKYVILDFWGSWCVWCIKGFPKMKEY